MPPPVALGVSSALAIGTADYIGGFLTGRIGARLVLLAQQSIGLIILLALLPFVHPGTPTPANLMEGVISGALGVVGLGALYRGLAMGNMGVVAALSGAGAVCIPLLWGIVVLGHTLPAMQLAGIAAAVGAGVCTSTVDPRRLNRTALGLALVAATVFGAWFVLLNQIAQTQPFWAVLLPRVGGTGIILLSALHRPLRIQPPAETWPLLVATAVLDLLGTGAAVAAFRVAQVGVVAALEGLYPVVTMLLARAFLGERLSGRGWASVGLSWLGIGLISLG